MPARHLILVGGGHSHVLVLASLAARPEPRLRVSVVSPDRYTTYSGMVPGVIAGQYALREAQIDVESLTRRARRRIHRRRAPSASTPRAASLTLQRRVAATLRSAVVRHRRAGGAPAGGGSVSARSSA